MKKLLLIAICVLVSAGPLYGLTPKIKLDMLKSKLAVQLKGGEYAKALDTIAELKSTNTELPESLAFFEGKALFESGHKAQSYKVFESYLMANGEDAKYYKQSVEYLVKAEAAYLAEIELDKARKESLRKQQRETEEEGLRIAAKKDAEKTRDDQFRAEAVDIAKTRKYFLDKDTGLMWAEMVSAKNPRNLKYENPYIRYIASSESQAKQYCETLVVGEYDDWHIPTMDEYSTIYKLNKRATSVGINWPDGSFDVWVQGSERFWDRHGPSYSNNLIYLVDYDFSVVKRRSHPMAELLCARTASADQFKKFFGQQYKVFEKNGRKLMVEDTFYSYLDVRTNVRLNVPIPSTVYRYPKFSEAKSYCSNLKLAGHKDWRLPTTDDFVNILPCSYEHKLNFPRVTGRSNVEKIWGVSGDGFFAKPVVLDVSKCRVEREKNEKRSNINVRCVRDMN